ncbi:hypothetical protein FRC07_000322 [Ceratobasidium sp. 392]|nr:hypothetical protein FRC07_000322 [Ceratobasidium sp. 392]
MKGQTTVDAQEYPIEAVTLYSKRAEVRRVIELELKARLRAMAGRNDYAITNLPSSIVPDTFHVSGLSAGQASVVDTTCVVPRAKASLFGFAGAQKKQDALNKKSQTRIELEMKKNQLLREQSLIHAKNDVLLSYAKTLTGENTQREDFVEFLSQFNEAGQESLAATSQIESAVEDVEVRIKKLSLDEQDDEDEDEEPDLSPKQKTKAGVVITAKEDCSVKLIITYVVSGASWTPAYELHAVTDSATKAVADTVTLHYRASVVQTTGEDWDDVNLTLSTAELSTSTSVPTLARSFVRDTSSGLFRPSNGAPSEPQQQHQHQLFEGEQQSSVLVASNPEFQPLDHGSAEAKDQVLASTYRVDTPVRVQSNFTPHRVTIMTVQLAAKTEYVAVPALTRSAYLQCKIKNTTSHQFPPGSMVTYLDGSYIERSNIWLVLPKSEITRSLGTDPGIRIAFKRGTQNKKIQHAAVFARQTITVVTDTLTIKNARAAVVPRVLIRHAIPTPGGDDRFRVTLKEPDGLAQLESGASFKLRNNVNGRWVEDLAPGSETSGLMQWSIEQLAAEGSEEIKMVYEVTAPEGVKWHQT